VHASYVSMLKLVSEFIRKSMLEILYWIY